MTASSENKTEKKEPVIKESSKTKTLIYVGPAIKGLQRFSSFVGGYPIHFKEHIEKSPAFKNLFIEPEHLTSFELNVKDVNSVESMFFEKTKQYFSEVK